MLPICPRRSVITRDDVSRTVSFRPAAGEAEGRPPTPTAFRGPTQEIPMVPASVPQISTKNGVPDQSAIRGGVNSSVRWQELAVTGLEALHSKGGGCVKGWGSYSLTWPLTRPPGRITE